MTSVLFCIKTCFQAGSVELHQYLAGQGHRDSSAFFSMTSGRRLALLLHQTRALGPVMNVGLCQVYGMCLLCTSVPGWKDVEKF